MAATDFKWLRLSMALARAKGALEVAGQHYKCAATSRESLEAEASLEWAMAEQERRTAQARDEVNNG